MFHHENQSPVNLEGVQFFEVTAIEVNEWHALPDGQGKAEQLHLWLKLAGSVDTPLVVRFRSPRPVDELIVALMTHRKAVWG